MENKEAIIEENKAILQDLLKERKLMSIKLNQVSYLIQGYENTIKSLEEETEEQQEPEVEEV
tara:strand:+ start:311 stop:496 length:186 start_codon:yes stop_codon:yes gene_type:complete